MVSCCAGDFTVLVFLVINVLCTPMCLWSCISYSCDLLPRKHFSSMNLSNLVSKSLLFVSTTFMIVKHTQTVLSLPLSYFYCPILRSGVGGAGEPLFDWKVLERFDILIMAQDGDFIIRHQFSCSWILIWKMINVSEVTSKKMWPCSLLWVCCRTRWRQSLLLIVVHIFCRKFSRHRVGQQACLAIRLWPLPWKFCESFLATGHRYKQYSVENDPLTDQHTH